jgi:hypothetical protein
MKTKRKYLGFDIETAKVHDGADWRSCRPLRISCAATLLAGSDEVVLWQGGDRMSREQAAGLVEYLSSRSKRATPSLAGMA